MAFSNLVSPELISLVAVCVSIALGQHFIDLVHQGESIGSIRTSLTSFLLTSQLRVSLGQAVTLE